MPDQDQAQEISRGFAFEVSAVTQDKMLKKGTIAAPDFLKEFVVYSDEGEITGGGNTEPTPIAYFMLSAAFCTLTQLGRYGEMMKVNVKSAKVTAKSRFRTEGSVLRETIRGSAMDFEMHIEIDSDSPPERVAALIRNAEAGCYVVQTIRNPTPVERTVALNGEPFDPDALPK